jgi:hypothetical protein
MKWKQIDQHPRSYVLIFNTGDELAKGPVDLSKALDPESGLVLIEL